MSKYKFINLQEPPAYIYQIDDLASRFFVNIKKIKKEGYKMLRVNLDKVQAEFLTSYENAKQRLEEAKSQATERARAQVVESEAYKAEVERHTSELAVIAERYIAEQSANDKAVVELEATVKVYEDYTVVEEALDENETKEEQ